MANWRAVPATSIAVLRVAVVYPALRGDWESARDFIKDDPSAKTAVINIMDLTLLHVAAGQGHWIFVKELVKGLEPESLEVTDLLGNTALHRAANAKTAEILVNKHPKLTQMTSEIGWIPLMYAAKYVSSSKEQKDLVMYLSGVTTNDHPNPFLGYSGAKLIYAITSAGLYDTSLALIERYPNLATEIVKDTGDCALLALAEKPHAFLGGSQLSFWQRCIYSRRTSVLFMIRSALDLAMIHQQVIPMNLVAAAAAHNHIKSGDVENPQQSLTHLSNRAIRPTLPGACSQHEVDA